MKGQWLGADPADISAVGDVTGKFQKLGKAPY
jgi:hypothetical protein